MTLSTDMQVRVTEIEQVTDRIKRFRFERTDGAPMPGFSAGSHTVVIMRTGHQVRRNPYSLMGSPFDNSCYQISVLRTEGLARRVVLHARTGARWLRARNHPTAQHVSG